ncbi:MAG: antibiotic biosynthesis monooxygenase [Kiritimatiellales bacterium]|nr:antibiotic biosynthesis monooxygenase [Kiritimatiellales bacterium]
MINVIATIKVKPGTTAQFAEIMKKYVPAVRAEDGCIEYTPAVDFDTGLARQIKDENAVTVIEKWESPDALNTHLASPHMAEFKAEAGEFIEDLLLTVVQEA